ncbi:hypothetical protein CICLE_v10010089mg [Citrus x clementina]|uniref:Uncharacterized protein n=1 Tax=Citrus clementina TaxID=85681 RepID=V4UN35_CITCL|nr:hypothetical protein CICLE_v10010089mg [Citrus x clementina]
MPLIISYYYYYFRGNIIYFATSASGHRHCRAMGPILTREHFVILSGLWTLQVHHDYDKSNSNREKDVISLGICYKN